MSLIKQAGWCCCKWCHCDRWQSLFWTRG